MCGKAIMILTSLTHAGLYKALHPRIAAGIDYLIRGDWQGQAPGTYMLDGDHLSAIIQHYDTIPLESGKWEAHRVYTDIQFVASGVELIGSGLPDQFTPVTEFDAAKDIAFYTGRGDLFEVRAGMFAILFPHDVHMPRIQAGVPSAVQKIVLKVRVD
jgi:YhcH/YjgK/YiaL family protein